MRHILLHYDADFYVTSGPHEGKFMRVATIDVVARTVTSAKGTVFPADTVLPVLIPLNKIAPLHAEQAYNIYFNEPNGTRELFMRVIGGEYSIHGDYEEVCNLINYLVRNKYDAFNLITKGQACEKNNHYSV